MGDRDITPQTMETQISEIATPQEAVTEEMATSEEIIIILDTIATTGLDITTNPEIGWQTQTPEAVDNTGHVNRCNKTEIHPRRSDASHAMAMAIQSSTAPHLIDRNPNFRTLANPEIDANKDLNPKIFSWDCLQGATA